ncbi:MAG TPA: NlpC/P60 family protein [Beijerinckiaceae bacterium]|nr:NlpC/P60 family protein [Beijerinckiaceae bacterium]
MTALTRPDIISAARAWIGTPYLHQASLRGIGCDCLGLLRGVWREVIGSEPETPPPYAPDWAEAGFDETFAQACRQHLVPVVVNAARPGDVLLFRWRSGLPAKHAAILTAADHIIHAHDGAAVAEVPLGLWRRRIAFAFCFPGVID